MGVEIVDLGGDSRILYAVPLTSVPSLSKVAMRSGAGTKSGDLFLIIIMIEEAAQHRRSLAGIVTEPLKSANMRPLPVCTRSRFEPVPCEIGGMLVKSTLQMLS